MSLCNRADDDSIEKLVAEWRKLSFDPEIKPPTQSYKTKLDRTQKTKETHNICKSTSALRADDVPSFRIIRIPYENLEHFCTKCGFEMSINQIDTTDSEKQRLMADIKRVYKNNEHGQGVRNETHVDKMLETLLRVAGFDSDNYSVETPKGMFFQIGNRTFSSNADRCVMDENSCVVLTAESKHIKSSTFQKGEIQLICHMLASLQHNIKKTSTVDLDAGIFGIRLVSSSCFFYYIKYNKLYFDELKCDRRVQYIYVDKYPGNHTPPLNLAKYAHCVEAINILRGMRESITRSNQVNQRDNITQNHIKS